MRRSLAILIVYVVAIAAFVAFLAVTLTPLINEILRFVADFPKLAADLDAQLQKLGDFYAHLQIPAAVREWIDGRHRRDRPGRHGRRRRARSDLPAAAHDRCRESPRARVRLPDPAGLGRSTCSRTRPPSSRPSIARFRRPGGSTPGRSSRPSSTISGSGCAASSSSVSRSGSSRSSGCSS